MTQDKYIGVRDKNVNVCGKVAGRENVKHIRFEGKTVMVMVVDGALRLDRNSRAQQMPRKHSATCSSNLKFQAYTGVQGILFLRGIY